MFSLRDVARIVTNERQRVLELAAVVFLWQAAVGVYFLSLVQQYLPMKLEAGAAYTGYAMAAYGFAKFILQPAAGWLADRIGRRVTMVAGMGGSVPVLVLMMSSDERVFLAASALLGACAAAMWPAFMAHVGDTTPSGRRGRTMSIINLAQMAGIGTGTVVGVLAVDLVTYGAAFWACIGFTVVAVAMVIRTVPERVLERAASIQAEDARPGAPSRAAAWTPGIAMLGLIVLFLTVGTSLHTPMIGAYTRDVLNVKMSYMALLMPAPALVAGVVFWRLSQVADRVGRHVTLVAGLFVAAAAIFALTLTDSPYIAVNLVVVAAVAYALSIPAWGAAALDATDVGSRGLWLGILSAVQGLGVAGGQALGGVIGGIWGPLAPFKLAALLLMVALTLILVQLWHQSRRRIASTPAAPAATPVSIGD